MIIDALCGSTFLLPELVVDESIALLPPTTFFEDGVAESFAELHIGLQLLNFTTVFAGQCPSVHWRLA